MDHEITEGGVVVIDGYDTTFTVTTIAPTVVVCAPVNILGYPYQAAYRREGWDFQVANGHIRPLE
jgi:hypothetical protein